MSGIPDSRNRVAVGQAFDIEGQPLLGASGTAPIGTAVQKFRMVIFRHFPFTGESG